MSSGKVRLAKHREVARLAFDRQRIAELFEDPTLDPLDRRTIPIMYGSPRLTSGLTGTVVLGNDTWVMSAEPIVDGYELGAAITLLAAAPAKHTASVPCAKQEPAMLTPMRGAVCQRHQSPTPASSVAIPVSRPQCLSETNTDGAEPSVSTAKDDSFNWHRFALGVGAGGLAAVMMILVLSLF